MLIFGLLTLLAPAPAVAPDETSPFCERASAFAATGSRSRSHLTDYVAELEELRKVAPPELVGDIQLLIISELTFDPERVAEEDVARMNEVGARVGAAIEEGCGLQLPGIQSTGE